MANRPEVQVPGRNKGISKIVKQNKRAEAEARNALTPTEKTKAFRLGRDKAAVVAQEKRDIQMKGRKRRNRKADEELVKLQEVNSELLRAEL